MSKLVSVTTQEPYQLTLQYEDGISGTINIANLFHKKKFAELQHNGLFDKVVIDSELGVPTRPNQADICADSYHDLFTLNTQNAVH